MKKNDTAGIMVKEGFTATEVDGVSLWLEGSTSRARIFNIALKLAVLDWTDPTIQKIEKLVDARLIKLGGLKLKK